jgi:hypothetical protein
MMKLMKFGSLKVSTNLRAKISQAQYSQYTCLDHCRYAWREAISNHVCLWCKRKNKNDSSYKLNFDPDKKDEIA